MEQTKVKMPKRYTRKNILGTELFFAGRYDESIVVLDQELAIHPDNACAWAVRGSALSKLKHAEAIESFNQALTFDPDDAMVWTNRGDSQCALGRYSDALASYNKAISIDSGLAMAWNRRGTVLFEIGLHTEALISYANAVAIKSCNAENRKNGDIALQKRDTKSRDKNED